MGFVARAITDTPGIDTRLPEWLGPPHTEISQKDLDHLWLFLPLEQYCSVDEAGENTLVIY